MNNRISYWRKKRGITAEQLADLTGTTSGQISRLETGKRRLDTEWLEKISGALHVGMLDLIEERKIRISEYVGDNGEIRDIATDSNEFVFCPPGCSLDEVVAVKIKSDSMYPAIQRGSVIFYNIANKYDPDLAVEGKFIKYNKPSAERFSEFFNRPCVITLKFGAKILRSLKRGSESGTYTLTSYNSPDIENVEIRDAYKIFYTQNA